jgi:hypothetical protein
MNTIVILSLTILFYKKSRFRPVVDSYLSQKNTASFLKSAI